MNGSATAAANASASLSPRRVLDARGLGTALFYSAVICFGHIHQSVLSIDGVRYAHIANSILRSGNWWELYDEYGGGSYANKPPLLFWLLALGFKQFGYSSYLAHLTTSSIVFTGLVLLFLLAQRLFGGAAGLVALLLFTVNQLFFRSVLEVNFEGLILLGTVLFLFGLLPLRGRLYTVSHGVLCGLGLLLLLQSKPPFILLLLAPLIAIAFLDRSIRSALMVPRFLIPLVLLPALGASWFLLKGDGYVSRAVEDQVAIRFEIWNDYLANLKSWTKAVGIGAAPLSLLGLYFLLRKNARMVLRPHDAEERFLLLLFLEAIPIILLIESRGRYLLIPMVALSLLVAREAVGLITPRMHARARRAVLAAGALALVLVLGFGMRVHRKDPLLEALALRPELLENGTVFCVNSGRRAESTTTARRAGLLLDLEYGVRPAVYNSAALPLDSEQAILAERRCAEELRHKAPTLEVVEHFPQAVLLHFPATTAGYSSAVGKNRLSW